MNPPHRACSKHESRVLWFAGGMILLTLLILTSWASAQMPPGERGSPEDQQRRAQWRQRYFTWREQQEADWQAASDLARENSPNRWMLYEQLPDTAPAKERIRNAILRRYQMLQAMGDSQKDVYDLAVTRMKLEDEAWAVGRDIRAAEALDKQTDLRDKLRQIVQTLVDRHFDERKTRIDRLKQAVAQEEQRLAEDQGHKDLMIDRQMRSIIDDEEHLLRPPPPGGRGGPGMGRGPGDDGPPNPDRPRHGNREDRPRREENQPPPPPAPADDQPAPE